MEIVPGAQQFARAFDSNLIQNDQRNETQEGMIKDLYTAAQTMAGPIAENL